MKKELIASVVVFSLSIVAAGSFAQASPKDAGEAKFKEACAMCHPNGGNIINPKKTLHKNDLEANNVKTIPDIINTLRNPGPGMTKYDKAAIPDKLAKEIAEYIVKAFK